MFYISAASTISHQPTFRNEGFAAVMGHVAEGSVLINPDFKEYIDAGLLRRMSKILRMSVACAKECLAQAGIDQPDSIVVGTGLGCLLDTEKFLNNFLTIEGLLPPTAFIQSTHNTIAGQISLSLGNHGYNMTHTQNTLSFEHALLDAMLLLGEDDSHVLVGAADEHIGILDEIAEKLNVGAQSSLASGSSFFVVDREQTDRSLVKVLDVETNGLVENKHAAIESFLARNKVNPSDLQQVFFAENGQKGIPGYLTSFFNHLPESGFVNYPLFSGYYATNSAFGLHFAMDKMNGDKAIRNVLICNHLINSNLGLTLLQSIEA